MRFHLLASAAAACVVCSVARAGAQGISGAYNATPITLAPGQFAPLQADQHGYLAVDCLAGCSSATGSGGSVGQGAPAAIGNAWPFYLEQGGAAVGTSNGLAVTDTQNGAAISNATMPSGGSGTLGWLSAIANTLATGSIVVRSSTALPTTDTADGAAPTGAAIASGGSGMLGWLGTIASELAGMLNVQQVAAGTVADTSVSIGTVSTAAVAAASGTRYRATLTNTSTTTGNTVWCRADGGIAALSVGVPLAPNGGGYEWDFPLTGARPAPAIDCIATSAASTVAVEYVQ